MISIGAVYRGPELRGSPINRALMNAARAINDLRGPLVIGTAPLVNAVFVVPGSLGSPDFDGLQFGDYSKKDKAVVVQIAVPIKALLESEVMAFIADALHGANAMAFEFFRQQGQQFPLREAERLVADLTERLRVVH